MNSLLSCSCGHTLEHHLSDGGCDRCACPQTRTEALDALVDAVRDALPDEKSHSFRTTASGRTLRMVP
jgi:hypothetical protein